MNPGRWLGLRKRIQDATTVSAIDALLERGESREFRGASADTRRKWARTAAARREFLVETQAA